MTSTITLKSNSLNLWTYDGTISTSIRYADDGKLDIGNGYAGPQLRLNSSDVWYFDAHSQPQSLKTTRADLLAADTATDTALNIENQRAISAELKLTNDLAYEVTRAKTAEGANNVLIAAEVLDRKTAVSEAKTAGAALVAIEETARIAAVSAEETARIDAVSAEAVSRNDADAAIIAAAGVLELTVATNKSLAETATAAETAARVNADGTLTTNLSNETTRATNAEVANADAILAETTRATAAEVANADAILAEKGRLDVILDGVANEFDTLLEIVNHFNAEGTTAGTAHTALMDRVAALEATIITLQGGIPPA